MRTLSPGIIQIHVVTELNTASNEKNSIRDCHICAAYECGMQRTPLVVETNRICTVCAPFQSVVGLPELCTTEVSGATTVNYETTISIITQSYAVLENVEWFHSGPKGCTSGAHTVSFNN